MKRILLCALFGCIVGAGALWLATTGRCDPLLLPGFVLSAIVPGGLHGSHPEWIKGLVLVGTFTFFFVLTFLSAFWVARWIPGTKPRSE